MKKVAIITPNPEQITKDVSLGGVDRHTLLLMRILRRQGCDVIIGGPTGFWSKLPTPITTIASWHTMVSTSVDIVIAQSPFGLNVPADIPLIYVAHGCFAASSRANGAGFKRRMWRKFAALFERQSIKGANYAVAVSEAVSKMILKYYKRSADEVLLNAIDIDFWSHTCRPQHNKSRPICLFVGLPTKGKGFDIFCQVANALYNEAEFIAVLGVNPKSHPSQKIKYIIRADESTLREVYHTADLILHPSHFEGCSYALIEGWACSAVTLMAPVGHVPEIASRYPWVKRFIIPSYDSAIWIEAVRKYLNDLSNTFVNDAKHKFFYLAKELHSLPQWEERWLWILEKFL